MFRRPPAEADIQRHFRVSSLSVHQMVVTLKRNGLIRRQPGVRRSIEILIRRNACQSYNGCKSTSQHHCEKLLVPRAAPR
ncbi:hypothetical protein [Mesorhizobium sp. ORM16]|uniref:hypothetical protein n=1 Tax=Mesorhizobium sp. ORM16 TaxID=3376989 RepID=UPI0038573C87